MAKFKLLHKADKLPFSTYFYTPARYYGVEDGNVYVIYKESYTKPRGKEGFEFVLEQLLEFSYDYKKGQSYVHKGDQKRITGFFEKLDLDKPDQNTKIINKRRSVKTFGQAEYVLLEKMKIPPKGKMIRTKPPKSK